MDTHSKHTYFTTLHRQLAQRYLLTIEAISYLRDMAIGNGKSQQEITELLKQELFNKKRAIKQLNVTQLDGNSQLNQAFSLTLLNLQAKKTLLTFLKTCSKQAWSDITQVTPYDKRKDYHGTKTDA